MVVPGASRCGGACPRVIPENFQSPADLHQVLHPSVRRHCTPQVPRHAHPQNLTSTKDTLLEQLTRPAKNAIIYHLLSNLLFLQAHVESSHIAVLAGIQSALPLCDRSPLALVHHAPPLSLWASNQ